MKILRAPKFWLKENDNDIFIEVNEYTVRAAQRDVAKGLLKNISVMDEYRNIRYILPNGRLSGPLKGFDLSANLMMQIIDNEPVDDPTKNYEIS